MKKITTKTITIKEEYKLSPEISYIRIITNNKITSNSLVYKGKLVNGYGVTPLYKMDLEILKIWNPFWGENVKKGIDKKNLWLTESKLPEPEAINLSDIILVQGSTHRFYNINKEPIPVVIPGDYIEAHLNDKYYDLKKLKKHFDNHKNIVECSEILDVPYYNSGDGCFQYIQVLVYPEKKWLKKLDEIPNTSAKEIFTTTYDKLHPDFLKTRKFQKQIIED